MLTPIQSEGASDSPSGPMGTEERWSGVVETSTNLQNLYLLNEFENDEALHVGLQDLGDYQA